MVKLSSDRSKKNGQSIYIKSQTISRILSKSILLASIIHLTLPSIIINKFAAPGLADSDLRIQQKNKLNELLPQNQIDLEKYNKKEEYKSAYQRIISIINANARMCNIWESNSLFSGQWSSYDLCIIDNTQEMIGKLETSQGNSEILVLKNGKPAIVADKGHQIIWFFSEGKLVAQLSLGSQDTLKTNFSSKEYQEVSNRALVIVNNLSGELNQLYKKHNQPHKK